MNRTLLLALQSVGGAAGTMVSIKSVVAVSSVLGFANKEGAILRGTVGPMLLDGVIAALMGQVLVRL
jgi:lactate permease